MMMMPAGKSNRPVDDAVLVKILQAENHAAGVEHTASLREHVVVNMHHEVTAARVLHHKEHLVLQRTYTQVLKN